MDTCPSCERKFEKITDFPTVFIKQFKMFDFSNGSIHGFPSVSYVNKKLSWSLRRGYRRGEIPRVLPQGLFEQLEDKPRFDSVSHEGLFYIKVGPMHDAPGINHYYAYPDMTDVAKKALASDTLKIELTKLEQLVGKTVRTSELTPFADGFGRYLLDEYTFSLVLGLRHQGRSDLEATSVFLETERKEDERLPYLSSPVGILYHEGRINLLK